MYREGQSRAPTKHSDAMHIYDDTRPPYSAINPQFTHDTHGFFFGLGVHWLLQHSTIHRTVVFTAKEYSLGHTDIRKQKKQEIKQYKEGYIKYLQSL